MNDILNDKELLETFKTEVYEHIESLENNIIDLSKSENDSDLINEIFRSFHTIKGSAHYLNLMDMVNVTHNTENLVDLLRKKKLKISEDVTDLLLEALDLIKKFMANFSNGSEINIQDELNNFFAKLKKYLPELKIEKTEKKKINEVNNKNIIQETVKKFIIFKINKTYFAFNVTNIIEIIPYIEVTKLPFVENHIIGLINFRGDLVPLIDLRIRFNSSTELSDETRIIVLEHNKDKVGILVDSVFEIVNININEIKKEIDIKHNIKNEWIDGVFLYNDNIIIILDKEKLLNRNENRNRKEGNVNE